MSRSFIYLRRTLCGASCAIVFGFGATQALASPGQAVARLFCSLEQDEFCVEFCRSNYGENSNGQCYYAGAGVPKCQCWWW